MRRIVLAAAIAGAAFAQEDRSLAGSWRLEADPRLVLSLERDGTGKLGEEDIRWAAGRGTLMTTGRHGAAAATYSQVGDKLVVGIGGVFTRWTRVPPPEPEAKKEPPPAPPEPEKPRVTPCVHREPMEPPKAREPPHADSRDALLSAHWCATPGLPGAGPQQITAFADGTLDVTSDGECKVQRYKLEGRRLLLDQGEGFREVPFQLGTRDGEPALRFGAREYRRCR